ncbi:MAG: FlgD immunoglobulin-like domain containing protein [Candidatus Latescibacterota bacterium]
MVRFRQLFSNKLMSAGVFALAAVFASTSVRAAHEFAFIITTDFATGSASTISVDEFHTVAKNVASVHSDAVARYHDGFIYVVNRGGGDNIQILDPDNSFATVRQFSVGNGSNPTDIAVISAGKAYVTRYNSAELWIVNPSTGTKTGSIDLAHLADSDGIPEMDQMCLVGNYLFVTIQRIDRNNYWLPVGTSYIAVVDVTADTLVDTDPLTPGSQPITLTHTNPYSDIQLNPYTGMLYVSCVGYWGVQDGCVELIDPVTFQSQGCMLEETAADGDIYDVEIVATDKGYAIIMDASFHNKLVTFNPTTGTLLSILYSPGDYVLHDIELAPSGELFLSDRRPTNPGIRLYDIDTDDEITTGPIDVGLPPADITFSINLPSAIRPQAPQPALLGRNYPNPFNPSTTIPFTLARDAQVTLRIYDVSGRLVRTLLDERRSAGEHKVRWHGRDDASRTVPSGIYFIALEANGAAVSNKLLLLK